VTSIGSRPGPGVLLTPPGPPIALAQDYQGICASASVSLYHASVGSDLVSIVEVAEMLGVSRQRVHQLLRAYPDFPAPEAELAVGRIWLRSAIEDWNQAHPRVPGRPTP
jgi:predicted DNA-binding transcriptional regulator AlpA